MLVVAIRSARATWKSETHMNTNPKQMHAPTTGALFASITSARPRALVGPGSGTGFAPVLARGLGCLRGISIWICVTNTVQTHVKYAMTVVQWRH